jgi:hypothetical protein
VGVTGTDAVTVGVTGTGPVTVGVMGMPLPALVLPSTMPLCPGNGKYGPIG